jgi:hypothetical protein
MIEEKEAFDFAMNRGCCSSEYLERMNKEWEYRFIKIIDKGQDGVDGQVAQEKKKLKDAGFKVRTKRIGFQDLARQDLIKIVGIKRRKIND